MLNYVQEESLKLYEQCRKVAENELDQLYTTPSHKGEKEGSFSSFPVLQSTHKSVNFVSGNTRLPSFQEILYTLFEAFNQYLCKDFDTVRWKFIDLGCGDGECLAASMLFDYYMAKKKSKVPLTMKSNLLQLIGIDLQKQRLESAEFLMKELSHSMDSLEHPSNLSHDQSFTSFIHILQADFLSISWSELIKQDAGTITHILYLCATCFTVNLVHLIMLQILTCFPSNTIIISLDKDLRQYILNSSDSQREDSSNEEERIEVTYSLELLFDLSCVTSWSQGHAYIYRILAN